MKIDFKFYLDKLKSYFNHIFLVFFQIQPEEFGLVQLFLIYVTLITAGYTLTSTAAISLFLSRISSAQLNLFFPWIYICIAISTALVALTYRHLIDRLPRIQLITATTGFFVLSFIIIRILIYYFNNKMWLYFFLMVWDETCSVVLLMVFFSYLGDYFDVKHAERLYGYIMGGMSLGAPIGGFGSEILLHFVRVPDLFIFSAAFFAISNIIAYIIWKIEPATNRSDRPKIEEAKHPIPIRKFIKNKYFRYIFLIITFAILCTSIEVYQLFYVANATLDEKSIARFMGNLFSYIGMAQLIINFILARWIMEKWGPMNVLLMLPLLLLLGSVGFFVYPILIFAAFIKFFDATLAATLNTMAIQVLYLPLTERMRMHIQSIAVGIVATSAGILGGVILLILSRYSIPIHIYSGIIFILATIWIYCVIRLRKLPVTT